MSLDAFLQSPRTFLDGNIVLPPARAKQELKSLPGKGLQSGVFEFAFVPTDSGRRLLGGACPMFMVQSADVWNAQHPRFRAYFCYYETDEIHMLVLDSSANIMFTPAMNGCSFGVGSETETGARIVGHANVSRTSGTQTGIQEQEDEQARQLNAAFGNPSIMGSSQYITKPGMSGTTVGMRADKKWSFCTQRWQRQGSEYILDGVTDFAL